VLGFLCNPKCLTTSLTATAVVVVLCLMVSGSFFTLARFWVATAPGAVRILGALGFLLISGILAVILFFVVNLIGWHSTGMFI
jgi:hypothetical protein